MANYHTLFSFSFSVSEKAGEFIKQGLEYFCGNEEAEFGPEWQAEFATTNAKVKSGVATPDDWANDESGETRTGCEYQVELVDGQAVFSVCGLRNTEVSTSQRQSSLQAYSLLTTTLLSLLNTLSPVTNLFLMLSVAVLTPCTSLVISHGERATWLPSWRKTL